MIPIDKIIEKIIEYIIEYIKGHLKVFVATVLGIIIIGFVYSWLRINALNNIIAEKDNINDQRLALASERCIVVTKIENIKCLEKELGKKSENIENLDKITKLSNIAAELKSLSGSKSLTPQAKDRMLSLSNELSDGLIGFQKTLREAIQTPVTSAPEVLDRHSPWWTYLFLLFASLIVIVLFYLRRRKTSW